MTLQLSSALLVVVNLVMAVLAVESFKSRLLRLIRLPLSSPGCNLKVDSYSRFDPYFVLLVLDYKMRYLPRLPLYLQLRIDTHTDGLKRHSMGKKFHRQHLVAFLSVSTSFFKKRKLAGNQHSESHRGI